MGNWSEHIRSGARKPGDSAQVFYDNTRLARWSALRHIVAGMSDDCVPEGPVAQNSRHKAGGFVSKTGASSMKQSSQTA